MNEGTLSYIMALIAIILLATGWREPLAKGVKPVHLLLFFSLMIAGAQVELIVAQFRLKAAVLVLAGYALFGWLQPQSRIVRLQMLVAAVFLGSFALLIRQWLRISHVIHIGSPEIETAVFLSLLTLLLTTHPYRQVIVLTLGLLLSEAMSVVLLGGKVGGTAESGAFLDIWWIAVVLARILSEVLMFSMSWMKKYFDQLHLRWKEWRNSE